MMCRTALACAGLSLVCVSARAQYWMDGFLAVPGNGVTQALVDVTDGLALGRISQQTGPNQTDHAFFYTHTGGMTISAEAFRWQPTCISADAQWAFGSLIPSANQITVTCKPGQNAAMVLVPITPLASDNVGQRGFGFSQTTFKVPMVFDRLNSASSFPLPWPIFLGTQTQDVTVTSCSAAGDQLFGVGHFLRESDSFAYTRALWWSNILNTPTVSIFPLPAGMASARIDGASGTGNTAVGSAGDDNGVALPWMFFRTTLGNQMLPLIDDGESGAALDISENGRTIVGNAQARASVILHGRIWNTEPQISVRSIESLLIARGIDISEWANLRISRISPNGQYLIGAGLFNGREAYWFAFVGDIGCTADINDDGVVDLADYFAFFSCWDTGGPCADVDAIPGTDLLDYFAFFNAFDAGC